jgi:hypothetical protein
VISDGVYGVTIVGFCWIHKGFSDFCGDFGVISGQAGRGRRGAFLEADTQSDHDSWGRRCVITRRGTRRGAQRDRAEGQTLSAQRDRHLASDT